MRIIEARTAEEIQTVRELFEEYWHSFGFTPCFQGFGEEVATLPGKYVSIGLLYMPEGAAGCVALRPCGSDRGEFKRLYVRPAWRGQRLGLKLLEWVIAEARERGYRELVADTMPEMAAALVMYERAGFERTEPYSEHPTPGALYLRMVL
jgi:GNAT superfamily N-acetyltransferase